MDAIDRSAMAAAWQAVADAQLILDQLPNLSTKEIEAVIGSKLVEANRDWMQSYIPAEAAAAFRKAVGEVCKEIESGSIAHSTTDDSGNDDLSPLSPRAAAALLHRHRSGR